MSRKRLSRNAPCPCGSGKKYKQCCYHKGFQWQQDNDGSLYKAMPINDEVAQLLQQQRQQFIDRHGRQPGADDALFFDIPPAEHLEFRTVQAMQKAGIDPAFIYAYEKTGGLLVTQDNQHLISDKDLQLWQAAVEEYRARQGLSTERQNYPLGTVAFYGPDDKTTTKIAAGVLVREGAEPILQRWVGTDVAASVKVRQEMEAFFRQHGVRSVGMSDGNLGCPHEEGEDFPAGEDCPFCPFWKGKQGSNRRD